MVYDGQWKLSKYSTGEVTLFHMPQDPLEQHNLIRDLGARDVYDRLDAILTREIMDGMQEAHFDRRVYIRDLSQDPWVWTRGLAEDVSAPRAGSLGVVQNQQMRGNCSPASMSSNRRVPSQVRSTTRWGCSLTTRPMIAASRP